MKTAYLYCTTRNTRGEKTTHVVARVSVPDDVYTDVERNYRTDWCEQHGYPSTDVKHYSLRTKRVIEPTQKEIQAIHAEHDRLKRAGKIPSAATAIMRRLAR